MAVAGLPVQCEDHALLAASAALGMLQAVATARQLTGHDGLAVRIGLHSGPVVAGVLRGDKPRFQLFGDTVRRAAALRAGAGAVRAKPALLLLRPRINSRVVHPRCRYASLCLLGGPSAGEHRQPHGVHRRARAHPDVAAHRDAGLGFRPVQGKAEPPPLPPPPAAVGPRLFRTCS